MSLSSRVRSNRMNGQVVVGCVSVCGGTLSSVSRKEEVESRRREGYFERASPRARERAKKESQSVWLEKSESKKKEYTHNERVVGNQVHTLT